jgi:hypothetical protein
MEGIAGIGGGPWSVREVEIEAELENMLADDETDSE